MKVRELIEMLREYNQETEVHIYDSAYNGSKRHIEILRPEDPDTNLPEGVDRGCPGPSPIDPRYAVGLFLI